MMDEVTRYGGELIDGRRLPVPEASALVQPEPGYYAIFVDTANSLPRPFCTRLIQRGTTLIYIGIATVSLHERLIKQDLRHDSPSTFFRGLGAILEYRPQPGSLVGKKNQNNYTFGPSDTEGVVSWIDEHLLVSWVKVRPALASIEECLIREHRPILNTTHNPDRLPELSALRDACRAIARAQAAKGVVA